MSKPADPRRIAAVSQDLELSRPGVEAALTLLGEGNTVPFIARYRKEATGGLDEVQLRAIQERDAYLEALDQRRGAILQSIEEQGKLTPDLKAALERCVTKAELEDLYLPFKKQRRTRATVARERGLAPLADRILEQPRRGDPRREAADFVDAEREVPDVEAALAGARDIVAEVAAHDADLRSMVREELRRHGRLSVKAAKGVDPDRSKFREYCDFSEAVARIPSHRFLAVQRGEREGELRSPKIEVDVDRLLPRLLRRMGQRRESPFSQELEAAVADGYKRLLAPSIEREIIAELKERSDLGAVDIFASNLGDILLAAPYGGRPVMGIDPGLRTGCKCVALDETGRLRGHVTIYPHTGRSQQAADDLLKLLRRFPADALAIGNGTGGRETERFVKATFEDAGVQGVTVVSVNEAGASVYSASDIAREEFPDLDLTIRGAISIGRRLQDPLAELVKIEPKALGVGQYQHDVDQGLLARKLDEVVEDCVNRVGVELNTASAPLLARVAGIGPSRAKKIVAHRDANGAFVSRKAVLKVAGLGPKSFTQAAGFLRIRNAKNPLDSSAVHPERYPLVKRMAADLQVPLKQLVGDAELARRIEPGRYVSDDVGEPTLRDILAELAKPGRDPRSTFEAPQFRDDLESIDDLQEGMVVDGVVTNVTAFGAFVDIGVHRDGLVHISQLADRFVRDPHEVAHPGQRMTVRVIEVDRQRGRISLSARINEGGERRGSSPPGERRSGGQPERQGGGRRSGSSGGRSGRGGEPRSRGQDPRRGGDAGQRQQGFSNNPFAKLLKR